MIAADDVPSDVRDRARRSPLFQRIVARARPPEPIGCCEWNEAHGRLTSREAEIPGAWRVGKTPYFKHWLDLVSARKLGPSYLGEADPHAHRTEQIWIAKGTQLGGTRSFLLAALGYLVDQHAAPMGYILPRDSDFSDVQKDRLRPLFDECPQLAKHLPQGVESVRLNLTEQTWRLDTCSIYYLSGSNAKDLRMRPLGHSFWDEFDVLPKTVRGGSGQNEEGNPISIGLDRHKAYERTCLALGVTSPTWFDGHGWQRLCSGSHERLMVRCTQCACVQELDPDQLCVVDKEGEIRDIAQAAASGMNAQAIILNDWGRWRCRDCGKLYDRHGRDDLVERAAADRLWVPGTFAITPTHPEGLWTPHADFEGGGRSGKLIRIWKPETTIRTGHIGTIFSPFVSLGKFAACEVQLIQTGTSKERMVHRNTWRALPTLPPTATPPPKLDAATTISTSPRNVAPPDTQRIVITTDQQGNEYHSAWFPYTVRAIRSRGRTQLLDEGIKRSWAELDELERTTWWVNGVRRSADAVAMDAANGNLSIYHQQWAAAKSGLRLLLAGRDNLTAPVLQRSNRGQTKKKGRRRIITGVRYWYTEPNTWKTKLNDLLRAYLAGTGGDAWALHQDLDPEYLASLGSEEQQTGTDRRGRRTIVWRPRTITTSEGTAALREDTHWWDCEYMQLVVAHVLGWDDLPELDTAAIASTPTASAGDDDVGSYATSGSVGDDWATGPVGGW